MNPKILRSPSVGCVGNKTLLCSKHFNPKRDVCEKPSQGFLLCPVIKNTNKQNLCFILTITILARVPNASFHAIQPKGDPEFGILEFQILATQFDRLNIWSIYDWRMGLYSSVGVRIDEQFVYLLLYLWNRRVAYGKDNGVTITSSQEPHGSSNKHRAKVTFLFRYCPLSLEISWRDFSCRNTSVNHIAGCQEPGC